MKYLLTITEIPEGKANSESDTVANFTMPFERLRLTVDSLSPDTLQSVIALLHKPVKPVRKPRSDKGKRKTDSNQQTLAGT